MATKIFSFILFILFIAVSVTLYKTDKKYNNLKTELKKKEILINDQLEYINNNNASHELKIKKKLNNLEFKKNKILNISFFKKENNLNIFKNNNQLVRGINNFFPGSGYLEFYNNNLFLISATGILAYSNNFNEEIITFSQIENNINDFLSLNEINKKNWFSVKDILITNDLIFVSYTNEQKINCWNTSVIVAKLNYKSVKFSKFFEPENCVSKDANEDNEFNAHQSGGKLFEFDNQNIIFSTGDYRLRKLAQDTNSTFGKILKLNIKSSEFEILSLGHRNPQGLLYNKKNDFIISTEHGPDGGDEINLNLNTNQNVKNFGWPVASYGEHYGGKDSKKNKSKYAKYPLYKSHKDYKFIEPLKYFVPSIGISQIVELDEKKYILSSLKDKAIYTFLLNDKNKIVKFKRIEVGERIRDMVYNKKLNKVFLFMEDTASIGLIKIY